MENMRLMRKHHNNTHTCMANNSHTPSSSSSLAMHRDSHMISKTKPKIRIIHIIAPEIIKTDVENFRELVQKLTGKPSGENLKCCNNKNINNKKETSVVARKKKELESCYSSESGMSEDNHNNTVKNDNNGGCGWGLDVTIREKVKEEVVGVCCSDESSCGGGYLGGFSDLEGFISEIGGFPFLPLDANNHMMQGFEEPQLLIG